MRKIIFYAFSVHKNSCPYPGSKIHLDALLSMMTAECEGESMSQQGADLRLLSDPLYRQEMMEASLCDNFQLPCRHCPLTPSPSLFSLPPSFSLPPNRSSSLSNIQTPQKITSINHSFIVISSVRFPTNERYIQ